MHTPTPPQSAHPEFLIQEPWGGRVLRHSLARVLLNQGHVHAPRPGVWCPLGPANPSDLGSHHPPTPSPSCQPQDVSFPPPAPCPSLHLTPSARLLQEVLQPQHLHPHQLQGRPPPPPTEDAPGAQGLKRGAYGG